MDLETIIMSEVTQTQSQMSYSSFHLQMLSLNITVSELYLEYS